MRVPIDEVVYFDCVTSHPTTGAAADADSTPTFEVFEEATDTDIGVGGNLTKRTSKTGNYRGSFTASAANGFEAGKWYSVIVSATVNSVAGKARVMHFYCVPAESSAGVAQVDVTRYGGTAGTFSGGRPEVNTTHAAGTAWGSGAITAGAIATDAITAAKLASDAGTEIATAVWASGTRTLTSLSGLTVDTVTTLTNLPTMPTDWLTAAGLSAGAVSEVQSGLATSSALATVAGYLDTEIAAIQTATVTDIPATLATIAGYLDTEVAAIKAKTDLIPAAPAAVSDVPTAVAIADAILGRNIAGGSSSGRTVKQALATLRNKVVISGGTLTVYDTDDTTALYTAAVTSDAAAEPITAVDPG